MIPGGFTEAKNADNEIKTLANSMKEKVEETLGETFTKFEAVLYTSQVVAGTNYNIKVDVGDERYVHIKIYVPLAVYNQANELLECQPNMTLNDPLN